MKISYNWLKEYLPQNQMVKMPDSPQKMGEILTSVGLEVEGIEKYEEVSNNLEGIIVGEVLSCEKHPDADKLKGYREWRSFGNCMWSLKCRCRTKSNGSYYRRYITPYCWGAFCNKKS